MWTPCSASFRNELSPLIRSAPNDRAPEARDAADDEHRERDEREVEVDLVAS